MTVSSILRRKGTHVETVYAKTSTPSDWESTIMVEHALDISIFGFSAQRTLVTTLFDLVGALVDDGATDAEVIATLSGLANSGRIRPQPEAALDH